MKKHLLIALSLAIALASGYVAMTTLNAEIALYCTLFCLASVGIALGIWWERGDKPAGGGYRVETPFSGFEKEPRKLKNLMLENYNKFFSSEKDTVTEPSFKSKIAKEKKRISNI